MLKCSQRQSWLTTGAAALRRSQIAGWSRMARSAWCRPSWCGRRCAFVEARRLTTDDLPRRGLCLPSLTQAARPPRRWTSLHRRTRRWSSGRRSGSGLTARCRRAFLASHGASGWPSRVARRTQPMGHLCGGLYTRDVAQLAAHVSHYAGQLLGGTPVQPGRCLCLRTRDVALTPARSELLRTLASICTSEPLAPGSEQFCKAPNTAETLVRVASRCAAAAACSVRCLGVPHAGLPRPPRSCY